MSDYTDNTPEMYKKQAGLVAGSNPAATTISVGN